VRDHVVFSTGAESSALIQRECDKTGKRLDVDRKNEGNQ